jgi:ubiquinone/menaquinone biosynthesis C-methylase UbiE
MREEVYDFIAHNEEDYWWYESRRVIFISVLKKVLTGFSRDGKIYDIGCCGGGNFAVWSSFSDSCIGIDMSEKALDSCRKFGYKELILTDAGDLSKIISNDASLVTLCDVLEHLEDDKRALEEAYRIVKPGGFIFVTAPAFGFLWGGADRLSLHKRRYSRKRLIQLLRGAHFKPVRSTYFNTFLFLPILAVRLMERFLKLNSSMEYEPLHGVLNGVLKTIFSFERHLIKYINLPFGVSLMAIAKK